MCFFTTKLRWILSSRCSDLPVILNRTRAIVNQSNFACSSREDSSLAKARRETRIVQVNAQAFSSRSYGRVFHLGSRSSSVSTIQRAPSVFSSHFAPSMNEDFSPRNDFRKVRFVREDAQSFSSQSYGRKNSILFPSAQPQPRNTQK